MVAAVTAVRIADRSPVDQSTSASSSFGSSSVASASGSGTTSSFEFLLLQQIGISLPPQSAYREPAETSTSQPSKKSSADNAQQPEQKPKENENTTAVNFFFVPTALLRDMPSAEIADVHTVTFNNQSDLSSTQVEGESTTERAPSSSSRNSTPDPGLTSDKAESSDLTTTTVTNPDSSSSEAAKLDSSLHTKQVQADSKVPQSTVAETFSVTSLQTESIVTPPSQTSLVRASSSTVGETSTVSRTTTLLGSTLSMSTISSVGSSSPLEQNSSDPNGDRNSSDQSKRAPALNDSPNISAATLIPNLAVVAGAGVAASDSTPSVSSQISNAIADRMSEPTSEGPTTVRIRLEQKDLGTVDVHLSVQEGVVSIRIVATDPLTQQLISGQMDELRKSLTQRGVSFGEMQVSSESGGQQSMGDPRSSGTIRITPQARFWRQPLAGAATSRSTSGLLNYVA